MEYVNEENFWYFCDAFTSLDNALSILDSILIRYNESTGLLDRMVVSSRVNGFANVMTYAGPQIVFVMDILAPNGSDALSTCTMMRLKDQADLPPMLWINLHSPSLDLPQRIEIPLRYLIRGMPSLKGTHMVYLHAVEINEDKKFVYYGRTKRGWMKRFNEHVRLAMKGSNRKFPALYGQAITNRYKQLLGLLPLDKNLPVYTGSIHVVCLAGASADQASKGERYLIQKHSLFLDEGMNMV